MNVRGSGNGAVGSSGVVGGYEGERKRKEGGMEVCFLGDTKKWGGGGVA